MAKNYDVDTLISQIRLSENIPDGEQVFTDDDCIVFLNEELSITVIPLILTVREDYFTVTHDYSFPLAQNGPSTITIPSEATGLKLRDVFIVDSQGNFFNLPRLTPSQAASYGNYWGVNSNGSTGLQNAAFYLQGNTVQLFPFTIAPGNTFRLLYHRKPNELISLIDCAQILSVDVGSGLVSLDNSPIDWTASTTMDIINSEPNFDFALDQNATNLYYATPATLTNQPIVSAPGGNTIFVSSGLAAQLQPGQYICETGTSPFIQYLPIDIYPLLKEAVAIRCLRALNDTEAEQMAISKFKQMATNVVNGLTTPRVEGKPKRIIGYNSIGKYTRNRGMGRW